MIPDLRYVSERPVRLAGPLELLLAALAYPPGHGQTRDEECEDERVESPLIRDAPSDPGQDVGNQRSDQDAGMDSPQVAIPPEIRPLTYEAGVGLADAFKSTGIPLLVDKL